MSRKGNCWDNACAKSFFGSLKNEWVKGKVYETLDDAKKDIFKYIEMSIIVNAGMNRWAT